MTRRCFLEVTMALAFQKAMPPSLLEVLDLVCICGEGMASVIVREPSCLWTSKL